MNDTHRMRARLTILILMTTVFVAGLLVSRYVYETNFVEHSPAATTRVATILSPPRALPDFELIDASARVITKQDLAGHWTLVFMGFTNCGDVCPTTLFTLSEAVQQLPVPPRVLFVSVDPERDSPEAIAAYVRGFGDDFAGATGTNEQLQNFAGSLGAAFDIIKEGGGYVVIHSSAVFLLDPAAQLHALFSAPHDASAIADDLTQILRAQTAASARLEHRL